MFLTAKIPDKHLTDQLQEALKLSYPMAALLANRGIRNVKQAELFLYGAYAELPPGSLMLGVKPALKIIKSALQHQKTILVFGDYDVDGISATALGVSILQHLGAKVLYYIPHRVQEGYGLSRAGIDYAAEQGCSLILSVDCGSTAYAEMLYARERNLELIVTDHHLMPAEPPPKGAIIINPKQPGCPYPYKDLSGVGVVFKLMQALTLELQVPELAEACLDLVALGTIADVVPLLEENRILVKTGLAQMQQHMRPALAAIRQQAGNGGKNITPRDVAFILAPRLNAAGRIETARLAVDLLLETDPASIMEKAKVLETINVRRQQLEEHIRAEAMALAQGDTGNFLLLAREGWHPGIIGITAAKLAESFNKPVLLAGLENDIAKGSARSFCGVNIYKQLEQCQELLLSYGGHSKAGGFKLKAANLEALHRALSAQLQHLSLTDDSFEAEMEIPLDSLNLELYNELEQLLPYGEGNPEPVFLCRGVRWEKFTKVGAQGQHLRGQIAQGATKLKVIAFNQANEVETLEEKVLYDLTFTLQREVWQEKVDVYLKIKDLYKISQLPVLTPDSKIIDRRDTIEKTGYLNSLMPQLQSALILVRRRSQAKALQHKLVGKVPLAILPGKPGSDSCSSFNVSYFHRLPQDLQAEDVFLLYPPPGLEHFQHPLYRSCKRIHFLFGTEDLEWEEKLQQHIYPTRDKLGKIYVRLKEVLGQDSMTTLELKACLKSQGWHRTALTLALRIFKELRLLKPIAAKKFVLNEHPVNLKDSKTYRSSWKLKEAFVSMKELLPYEKDLESLFAKD